MEFTVGVLLSLIAFVGVTASPIAVAVACWTLSRRLKRGWIVHLFVIPSVLGVEWLFTQLLFLAGKNAGEGLPDVGFAVVPGRYMTMLALAAYAVILALVVREKISEARRERRN